MGVCFLNHAGVRSLAHQNWRFPLLLRQVPFTSYRHWHKLVYTLKPSNNCHTHRACQQVRRGTFPPLVDEIHPDVDSNHRLSSLPVRNGTGCADNGNRTRDRSIQNRMLYQLSYIHMVHLTSVESVYSHVSRAAPVGYTEPEPLNSARDFNCLVLRR